MQVILKDQDHMSLLGLILRVILEKNLAKPSLSPLASGMRGIVHIRTGKMSATLCMEGEQWTLLPGLQGKASASVRGSLSAFTAAAVRKVPVGSILKGHLWPAGNLWTLMKLFWVIRGGAI